MEDRLKAVILASVLTMGAAAASAATLDFATFGDCAGGPGVSFTMSGSTVCGPQADSPDDPLDASLGFYWDHLSDTGAAIRADFASAATFVSVALGDWNADADDIFLQIFDAADNLLGETSLLRSTDSYAMDILSLSGTGIAYALFGTKGGDLGFIAADDFSFGVASVPVPAGGVLLATGLAAAAALRRKRRA